MSTNARSLETEVAAQRGPARKSVQAGNLKSPYVFVVGCPRSGTTLLQRMLDNHPKLAVAYDTLFIPAAVRNHHDKNPPVDAELIARIQGFRRFPRFGFPPGLFNRLAPQAADFADLVRLVYHAYARLHDKPLGGEKSPGYVRHMPLLQSLFPDTRFIHLVRDGRDVALSLMDWGKQKAAPKGPARKYTLWQESPVAVSALWWDYKISRGKKDARKLTPGSYTEVRYEELVARPETELQRLAGFLDLSYSEDMVNFHIGRTRTDPGLSAKTAWLPATRGIRDWRKTMPAADVELFEALAGQSLSDFGYERRHDRITPAVAEQAARYRESWNSELGRS